MDLAGVRVVYVCIIQIGFKLDVGRLADVRAPTLLLLGGSSPLAMRDGTEAIAGALPNAGYPRRVRALISRYGETAMRILAVLAGLFFVVGTLPQAISPWGAVTLANYQGRPGGALRGARQPAPKDCFSNASSSSARCSDTWRPRYRGPKLPWFDFVLPFR
ncbi:MAG: hypothetical protein E6I95_00895 [Chloroflexi bacterium]|nr:MAG: hypothetical protein E6I95_00895 [Chloroflexota bacterium]